MMGIASTHYVTREFAIQAILSRLYSATDEQLESLLETAIHNGFYNFSIVSKEQLEEEKKKEWGRYLDDITNLPEYNNAY